MDLISRFIIGPVASSSEHGTEVFIIAFFLSLVAVKLFSKKTLHHGVDFCTAVGRKASSVHPTLHGGEWPASCPPPPLPTGEINHGSAREPVWI
jgi:hypothetical protein